MNQKKIIGISGLIGAGKDTVADFLVSQHGFERKSFAGVLKDAVSIIFGWDREQLEGRTKESRQWREQIDVWWAQRLGIPHLTPRWILQHWGTDVLRNSFHNDIWVASIENQIYRSTNSIVITDARFPNEYDVIRSHGGLLIRVKKGPDPEWYQHAINVNTLPVNTSMWQQSNKYLNNLGIHFSETASAGMPVDFIIENDRAINDLYQKIENILQLK